MKKIYRLNRTDGLTQVDPINMKSQKYEIESAISNALEKTKLELGDEGSQSRPAIRHLGMQES